MGLGDISVADTSGTRAGWVMQAQATTPEGSIGALGKAGHGIVDQDRTMFLDSADGSATPAARDLGRDAGSSSSP